MEIVKLKQGSPEWLAHRGRHRNASDAPVMMGVSPYKTRTQLLREVATGIVDEVDPETQRRFDDGHRFEGLASPLAEEIIGEELAPLVGVDGRDSASFDGITMLEDQSFEHKTLNEALREALVEGCTGADLPLAYQIQMEHQCKVAGTVQRVLFMASRWEYDRATGEWECKEVRHCWYTPNLELRARIFAAWDQFDADVAAWKPEEPTAPKPTAHVIEALPALVIRVEGRVVSSNLDVYREVAEARIASVKTKLETDQDFADAEATVKHFKEGADQLKLAKQQAQAEAQSIDEVFRTIDHIVGMMDAKRLELSKLVESEKLHRRTKIVTDGQASLRQHLADLTKQVGRQLPPIDADFAGAIKGKKSLDSMKDAVSVVLADAKVRANQTAERMETNLATIRRLAGSYTGMFPDEAGLLLKAPEDCEALVQARVDKRKAEDEAKLEAERQRIRAEEETRAQAAAAPAPVPAPVAPMVTAPAPAPIARTAPPAPAVALDTAPTVKLGEIGTRLGFNLTAEFLRALGFEGRRDRSTVLFSEADFDSICRALIEHIQDVLEGATV